MGTGVVDSGCNGAVQLTNWPVISAMVDGPPNNSANSTFEYFYGSYSFCYYFPVLVMLLLQFLFMTKC